MDSKTRTVIIVPQWSLIVKPASDELTTCEVGDMC